MDDLSLGQLTQQIKWMEDERRKDKAQISTLQEQLTGQAREMADAMHHLQEMDSTLKASQATLARLLNTDRVLEEFKADVVAMLNRLDDDRKKSDRETDRIRNLSIETLQRQITELKLEVPRIGKIEEELRSQYRLGYTPGANARDGFRTIKVSVRGKGMTVRAREGYYARTR
jgi:chromosome segregation ATPase